MSLWLSPFDQTSTSCTNPRHIFQIQRFKQYDLTIRLALGWPSGAGIPNHRKASETPGSGLSDDTAEKKTPTPQDPQLRGRGYNYRRRVRVLLDAHVICCTNQLSKFLNLSACVTDHNASCGVELTLQCTHSTLHSPWFNLPAHSPAFEQCFNACCCFLFVLCMCPYLSIFLYRVSAGQVYHLYILNTVSL